MAIKLRLDDLIRLLRQARNDALGNAEVEIEDKDHKGWAIRVVGPRYTPAGVAIISLQMTTRLRDEDDE